MGLGSKWLKCEVQFHLLGIHQKGGGWFLKMEFTLKWARGIESAISVNWRVSIEHLISRFIYGGRSVLKVEFLRGKLIWNHPLSTTVRVGSKWTNYVDLLSFTMFSYTAMMKIREFGSITKSFLMLPIWFLWGCWLAHLAWNSLTRPKVQALYWSTISGKILTSSTTLNMQGVCWTVDQLYLLCSITRVVRCSFCAWPRWMGHSRRFKTWHSETRWNSWDDGRHAINETE